MWANVIGVTSTTYTTATAINIAIAWDCQTQETFQWNANRPPCQQDDLHSEQIWTCVCWVGPCTVRSTMNKFEHVQGGALYNGVCIDWGLGPERCRWVVGAGLGPVQESSMDRQADRTETSLVGGKKKVKQKYLLLKRLAFSDGSNLITCH